MAAGRPKKAVDAEVNLIPFINILAMSICFLLMTAVWYQVTAVPVKQSHGTEGAGAEAGLDLELKFSGASELSVTLSKRGRKVKQAKVEASSTQELLPKLDATLKAWVPTLAAGTSPETKLGTLVATGMVTPLDGVPYGDLVAVMDVLRSNDLVNLGVVPVRGK